MAIIMFGKLNATFNDQIPEKKFDFPDPFRPTKIELRIHFFNLNAYRSH